MAAMEKPAERSILDRRIEAEDITKEGLMARLRELLKGNDVSWFIAGERPFDWAAINKDKSGFMEELQSADFGTARMSVHVTGSGSDYFLFRVAG